jgi:hypothetical protein
MGEEGPAQQQPRKSEVGSAEDLDAQIGKRFLIIEILDDGSLACDTDDVAPYELPGIGLWLECLGQQLLEADDDEE